MIEETLPETLSEDEILAVADRVLVAGINAIEAKLGEGAAKAMPEVLAAYLKVNVESIHQERMNAELQAGNAHGFLVGPGQEFEN